QKQHSLIAAAEAKGGPEAASLFTKAHELRQQTGVLRERVAAAKNVLHEQLGVRGRELRAKILQEQALLGDYQANLREVSGDARHLVGRIAFGSFKRVRQQFYELVMKANVGELDVAFTRTQDKSQDIQKLSAEKEQKLHELDTEFKEVLKDVD